MYGTRMSVPASFGLSIDLAQNSVSPTKYDMPALLWGEFRKPLKLCSLQSLSLVSPQRNAASKLKPRGRQEVWIWSHSYGKCSMLHFTLLAKLWRRALKSIVRMLSTKPLGTGTHTPPIFLEAMYNTFSVKVLQEYKNSLYPANVRGSPVNYRDKQRAHRILWSWKRRSAPQHRAYV